MGKQCKVAPQAGTARWEFEAIREAPMLRIVAIRAGAAPRVLITSAEFDAAVRASEDIRMCAVGANGSLFTKTQLSPSCRGDRL